VIATTIQTLYRYNRWANERLLDTAAHLTPAQLLTAPSVLLTGLGHSPGDLDFLYYLDLREPAGAPPVRG